MDCFQDFCIACDKACTDGAYCSQACRMADLEKASLTSPLSPAAQTKSKTGFHLPAAYAFRASLPTSPGADQQSYFPAQPERSLSPSSSRSSLSSTMSASNGHENVITEQARKELRGYFSSFDKTRLAKRRSSLK